MNIKPSVILNSKMMSKQYIHVGIYKNYTHLSSGRAVVDAERGSTGLNSLPHDFSKICSEY